MENIFFFCPDDTLGPRRVMNGSMPLKKTRRGERIGAMAFPFHHFPDDERYFTQVFGDKIFVNHGYSWSARLKQSTISTGIIFRVLRRRRRRLRLWKRISNGDCTRQFRGTAKLASEAIAAQFRRQRGWEYFKQRWGHLASDPAKLEENTVNVKAYADHGDASDTVRYFRRSWAYRKHLLKKMIKRLLGA